MLRTTLCFSLLAMMVGLVSGECPERNMAFMEQTESFVLSVQSWEECGRKCRDAASCHAWTWYSTEFFVSRTRLRCELKKSTFMQGRRVDNLAKGTISGLPSCFAETTTTAIPTTTPAIPTTTTAPPIDAKIECNENGFVPTFTYNNIAGEVVHVDVKIGPVGRGASCEATVDATKDNSSVQLSVGDFGGGTEHAYTNEDGSVGCNGNFTHWNDTDENGVEAEKIKYEVGVAVILTETIRSTIRRKLKYTYTLRCVLSRHIASVSTSGNWTIDNENLVEAAETKEVKESFELATSLKFYQSSAYSNAYDGDFVAKNNDQIYMMVSEDNDNDLFVFTVEECWATAGSNAAEGDAKKKDVFFKGQCNEDSTVKFSSNFTGHWFKLNLLSFYFTSAPKDSIYFHCTLKICLQSGDCEQKEQDACPAKNRKRRSVGVIETRTITSEQRIMFDQTEIFVPNCGQGFVYDRVSKECTNQQLLEVRGIYLDIEWNPLYANTSSKVFREFAREKEYQLFAMLQATGRDRIIRGLKVIGATKGSVILDVQIKYAESTGAVHAFRELEEALRTRPSTTRVMRILNVREDKRIEYVPIVKNEKPDTEKLVLIVVVVVLFVVVFISGITFFKVKQIRQRSPAGNPGNPTAFDNKGIDA